jgi:hypothetical protein
MIDNEDGILDKKVTYRSTRGMDAYLNYSIVYVAMFMHTPRDSQIPRSRRPTNCHRGRKCVYLNRVLTSTRLRRVTSPNTVLPIVSPREPKIS